jgi:KDO2-lipid IV(A) lauroyltransferase
MLYLLYKMGEWLSLSFPLEVNYRVADFLGNICYFFSRKAKRITSGNLKVVLTQSGDIHNLQCVNRQLFVNFARYLAEFFRTARIDRGFVEKNVRFEGRENLDAALSSGKGALLVGAHIGNWELGAVVLALLGYKINIIAWIHKNRRINDFFLSRREGKGVKVIPSEGLAVRGVFSALQNNEAVALLGDIDYPNPDMGITVKLFGHDTKIPKGPALFSLRTEAPIVPTFVIREHGTRFRFVFEKPILPGADRKSAEALTRLTGKIAEVIESYIARYPSQWFMFRPRWLGETS